MDIRLGVTDPRNSQQQTLFGEPGLRRAGTPVPQDWHPRLSGRLGAPGLRCAGTPVRGTGVHDLPGVAVRRDSDAPGLRCAGTTVRGTGVHDLPGVAMRRDSGAPGLRYAELANTIFPASRCAGTPLRRDYGAWDWRPRFSGRRGTPGLRCAGANKFSGEFLRRSPFSDRSEQRVPPTVSVPRTGRSLLPRLRGRTPPRIRPSWRPGSWKNHPCPPGRRVASAAARSTPISSMREQLLLTGPLSRVASTPRRLCGSMRSRAIVRHLAPQPPGGSSIGAVRLADGDEAASLRTRRSCNETRAHHSFTVIPSRPRCVSRVQELRRALHRSIAAGTRRLAFSGGRRLCSSKCLVKRAVSVIPILDNHLERLGSQTNSACCRRPSAAAEANVGLAEKM